MAHFWDAAERQLLSACSALFADTRDAEGPAQILSAGFALRVERRTVALGELFRSGLYVDSLNLVRTAFEDWVTLSYYLLRKSPAEFLDDMQFDARRNRARLFMAIEKLTDANVAAAEVGDLPELFFDDARLPPRLPDLCTRSKSIGLEDVYRYVYPFLSMMSHGDMEALYEALPHIDGAWTPQAPARAQNDENRWAVWAWWFHLRTLTRAADAMGRADLEPLSDQLLVAFSDPDSPPGEALVAVMQREH